MSEPARTAVPLSTGTPIVGRDVLLVEEMVDCGTTICRLARPPRQRSLASPELCTLLHKDLASDLVLEPHWVGFDAPIDFRVGYGLDHAEDFRHLTFVASREG